MMQKREMHYTRQSKKSHASVNRGFFETVAQIPGEAELH